MTTRNRGMPQGGAWYRIYDVAPQRQLIRNARNLTHCLAKRDWGGLVGLPSEYGECVIVANFGWQLCHKTSRAKRGIRLNFPP